MVEAFLKFLVTICVLVFCVVVALWVIAEIGVVLPALAVKIIWVILALIALLLLVRFFRPWMGNWIP